MKSKQKMPKVGEKVDKNLEIGVIWGQSRELWGITASIWSQRKSGKNYSKLSLARKIVLSISYENFRRRSNFKEFSFVALPPSRLDFRKLISSKTIDYSQQHKVKSECDLLLAKEWWSNFNDGKFGICRENQKNKNVTFTSVCFPAEQRLDSDLSFNKQILFRKFFINQGKFSRRLSTYWHRPTWSKWVVKGS